MGIQQETPVQPHRNAFLGKGKHRLAAASTKVLKLLADGIAARAQAITGPSVGLADRSSSSSKR